MLSDHQDGAGVDIQYIAITRGYVLNAEHTFMRAQNAQFIWTYIHTVLLKCIIGYLYT